MSSRPFWFVWSFLAMLRTFHETDFLFRLLSALPVLGLLIVLGGCADAVSPVSVAPRQMTGATPSVAGIQLDPSMAQGESSKVSSDIARLGKFPVNGSGVKFFQDAFGGSGPSDVVHYLSERVHWILSSTTDVEQSLVALQGGIPAGGLPIGLLAQDSSPSGGGDPQVVASNIGTAIWYLSLAQSAPAFGVQIGSELVPIRSSRAGLIQIGKAYSVEDRLEVLRMSTLVHEARHSDCTGGVSASDLARIRTHQEPVNKSCGHMHVDCPPGHPYGGFPACDDHAWGAYAIESLYTVALAQSCPDCPQEDQKVALIVFADAASRILNLDSLLAGKLGAPDMSSSDQVIP